MLIRVTEEDIREGRPRSICDCPVARAIRRQTGRPVLVGSFTLGWPGNEVRLESPLAVIEFVSRFDSPLADMRRRAVPFDFELPDAFFVRRPS